MADFTVIFKSLAPGLVAGFGDRPKGELAQWAKNQRRFPERDLTKLPPHRQLEHWCVDQCLNALGEDRIAIVHDAHGKPFVQGLESLHISIAHHSNASGCWAAVVCAESPVGVDIETERQQLQRIASRFLHPDERTALGDGLASLSMAWAVKESMFKAHGPALDFREDLRIHWRDEKEACTSGIAGSVRGAEGQYRIWKLAHPNGKDWAWLACGPVVAQVKD